MVYTRFCFIPVPVWTCFTVICITLLIIYRTLRYMRKLKWLKKVYFNIIWLYYFRIDKLDFQLRSLQAQHQVTENDNHKRMVLLEQTTQALSMLENENGRLSQVKLKKKWFRDNQSLLFLLIAACLAEKQQIPIL